MLINIGFQHAEISKLFLMASHDINEDSETVEELRRELFAAYDFESAETETSHDKKYSIFDELNNQVFLKKLEVLGKKARNIS